MPTAEQFSPAPPCAACHRPYSPHVTHPATTCGYYWTAEDWVKEQLQSQLQTIHDDLDRTATNIMDRARGRFYPGTSAYREVLQIQSLREYILTHFE